MFNTVFYLPVLLFQLQRDTSSSRKLVTGTETNANVKVIGKGRRQDRLAGSCVLLGFVVGK